MTNLSLILKLYLTNVFITNAHNENPMDVRYCLHDKAGIDIKWYFFIRHYL